MQSLFKLKEINYWTNRIYAGGMVVSFCNYSASEVRVPQQEKFNFKNSFIVHLLEFFPDIPPNTL